MTYVQFYNWEVGPNFHIHICFLPYFSSIGCRYAVRLGIPGSVCLIFIKSFVCLTSLLGMGGYLSCIVPRLELCQKFWWDKTHLVSCYNGLLQAFQCSKKKKKKESSVVNRKYPPDHAPKHLSVDTWAYSLGFHPFKVSPLSLTIHTVFL